MRRLIPLVAALAALYAGASPVLAAAEVNGCDVVLTHPTASWGEVYLDGEDAWINVFPENGVVLDLTFAGGTQLVPGSYTVVWDTGETETFVLECDPYAITEEVSTQSVTAAAPSQKRSEHATVPTKRNWLPETSTDGRVGEAGSYRDHPAYRSGGPRRG